MIRNKKVFGCAIFAVLALGAVVASTAGATNFTASSYPTPATASSAKGNEEMQTDAGGTECKSHYSMAAISGPTETVTITPTYTECSAWGFLSATVTMNGCDYVVHSNGVFDIECSGSNKIVIVGVTCEMQIGSQTGLVGMNLSNSGTGISSKLALAGIEYTVTKDGFLCPFSGTGTKKDATYNQSSAIQYSSLNGTTIDIG